MEIPSFSINDSKEFIDAYNNQRTLADIVNEIIENIYEAFKEIQYVFYSDEMNYRITGKLEEFQRKLEPIERIFYVNFCISFDPELSHVYIRVTDCSDSIGLFLSMDDMEKMKSIVDYEIPKLHFR